MFGYGFCGIDIQIVGMFVKDLLNGFYFCNIFKWGRCVVYVDVINIFWIEFGIC